MANSSELPCLTCGACCAQYRVSFHWSETDPPQGGVVPLEWTETLTPFLSCMKGTNQKSPHCAALEGTVGQPVRCTIYERRPSPCREFGLTWKDGRWCASPQELERCNRARATFGLPPLPPEIFTRSSESG